MNSTHKHPLWATCHDCGLDFDLRVEGSEYDEGDLVIALCQECGSEENPTGRHLKTVDQPILGCDV